MVCHVTGYDMTWHHRKGQDRSTHHQDQGRIKRRKTTSATWLNLARSSGSWAQQGTCFFLHLFLRVFVWCPWCANISWAVNSHCLEPRALACLVFSLECQRGLLTVVGRARTSSQIVAARVNGLYSRACSIFPTDKSNFLTAATPAVSAIHSTSTRMHTFDAKDLVDTWDRGWQAAHHDTEDNSNDTMNFNHTDDEDDKDTIASDITKAPTDQCATRH